MIGPPPGFSEASLKTPTQSVFIGILRNNPSRKRRLEDAEFKRLGVATEKSRFWYLLPLAVLAVAPVMRQGKILGLRR